jgi:hypothetical protein
VKIKKLVDVMMRKRGNEKGHKLCHAEINKMKNRTNVYATIL